MTSPTPAVLVLLFVLLLLYYLTLLTLFITRDIISIPMTPYLLCIIYYMCIILLLHVYCGTYYLFLFIIAYIVCIFKPNDHYPICVCIIGNISQEVDIGTIMAIVILCVCVILLLTAIIVSRRTDNDGIMCIMCIVLFVARIIYWNLLGRYLYPLVILYFIVFIYRTFCLCGRQRPADITAILTAHCEAYCQPPLLYPTGSWDDQDMTVFPLYSPPARTGRMYCYCPIVLLWPGAPPVLLCLYLPLCV